MNKKSSNPDKKKVAKASAKSRHEAKPRPTVESGLTKAELEQFKAALVTRREGLSGNVNRMGDEALRNSGQAGAGDLSSMPFHMADLGTDNFEQEMTLGLIENEEEEMREIGDAIDRIDAGVFGVCEECNKPIPKDRIRAIPYAKLCVECKRKEEEG